MQAMRLRHAWYYGMALVRINHDLNWFVTSLIEEGSANKLNWFLVCIHIKVDYFGQMQGQAIAQKYS